MIERISVVIPAWNAGAWLAEAIQSALDQTEPPFEILVVDDGSSDHTPEVARSFGDRIRFFRIGHCGVSVARNIAIAHLRGDAFLNLDADDRLVPHALARLRQALNEAMAQDPRVAFAYPQYQMFGADDRISRFPPFDAALLKIRNYIVVSALIRADLVRQYRFDPAFNEALGDYDLYLTLAQNGWKGVRVDEPLLLYRRHDNSVTSQLNRAARQRALMRKLIRKHAAFYTPEERRQAIQRAENGMLVSLITQRRPDAPFRQRFLDTLRFASVSVRHAEFYRQLLYLVRPHRVAAAGTAKETSATSPS